MTEGNARPLPWRTVIGYAGGGFAQGILPILLASQLLYFYCEKYALLAMATFGAIRLVERVIGAVLEPVVGYLSDRTRTRWGRRRPWMAVGLPVLCLSFAAIWFPPSSEMDDTANIIWLAVSLMLFYASYTAVFAPYNALLPELSRDSKQRVRLSVWMALFEVLSNIAGLVASGPLLGLAAVTIAGIAFANGYQVLGVAASLCAICAVVPVFLFTKEKHQSDKEEEPFTFVRAVKASLKNRGFRCYASALLGFRMATFSAITGIPFIGIKLMKLSEEHAQYMLAVIILVATFGFPIVQMLANRYGKARIFRLGGIGFIIVLPLMGTIGLVPGIPLWLHGIVLFALAGFPVATLFVLPRAMLADVIDEDEQTTGQRREAIYTGMSGVVEKLGEALASGLVPFLFALLGSSIDQPLGLRLLGVLGALGLAAGLIGFRGYKNQT